MCDRVLLQNGAKVYITSRDAKACEQAAAKLTELGACAIVCVSEILSANTMPYPVLRECVCVQERVSW